MKNIDPIQLSGWIVYNLPELKSSVNELTHLKLQKLAYYCYGISIANEFDNYFQSFSFEPWKHGPVCREIYDEFKSFGSKNIEKEEIPKPEIEFPEKLESLLLKVLYLYGSLSPWKIRQQSHLEEPWKKAFKEGNYWIDEKEIKNSFIQKYFQPTKRISGPEFVFDLSSFKLDGIPTVGYSSFDELVETAKMIYFKTQ